MSPAAFHVKEHTVPTAHIREYARATLDDQEDVLYLAVKQYTPKTTYPTTTKVTIVGAHANGFPKELYEPLWDELYDRLRAKNIGITSIWIADVAHQGTSGVFNERQLGNDPSWLDHPRDMFLMVNHFRKEMKRPLIGIGHSMGGNNLVNLSLMHPRLFTTLILIDPVIQRQVSRIGNYAPARASVKRRDQWPSRKAAEAAFKRSKFYQTWDPRVLDLWVQYGLRDLPTHLYPKAIPTSNATPLLTADPSTSTVIPTGDKEVTLTTTKHQEVLTFLRMKSSPIADSALPAEITNPDLDPELKDDSSFYSPALVSTFNKLPHLRPSVRYIYGDQSPLSAPLHIADRRAMTGIGVGGSGGMKKGTVTDVTFRGVGHLIPMEDVAQTAEACADWVVPELERWAVLEAAERREWAAVPVQKRSQMTELFVRKMNEDGEGGARKASKL
ncbi:hypothetical protein LTR62_000431 [Meristemomyces frigidus]|uniref:Serine aminopeptidase S33 domain-containing protein n=1 Tax=Meristemomyces frigidus TaxID=1508187 RepID=A0AAN7TPE1_9PEZI|nr:hypothetical protein LTR62_000431 [Meristemomyces frigidus]